MDRIETIIERVNVLSSLSSPKGRQYDILLTEDIPYLLAALSDRDARIKKLEEVVNLYNSAADKFIRKCEAGRAYSIETLADMRECIGRAQAALKEASDVS